MNLPVNLPLPPMLAKRVDELPTGNSWIYEPKWDGFRVLVFRDGDEIQLQSRNLEPLARYFPELLPPLRASLPDRVVLDGELVIATPSGLDFERLQSRLHPAASRVARLAGEIPASIVCFDLLAEGDRDLTGVPFADRRTRLEQIFAGVAPPLHLTPATRDRTLAADWFARFEGAGLDGVMAKLATGVYEPNKRVMLKVKHQRECDCVVAGFRWHKDHPGTAVGSLLLGLFDAGGDLQHVGVAASFTGARRRELVEILTPYRADVGSAEIAEHPWRHWAEMMAEATAAAAAGDAGAPRRLTGGGSRWNQGKDLSFEPLVPSLVAEVGYDHMEGRRFRHTAQFRRWRADKAPADCTYAQLEGVAPHELAAIFALGS